MYCKKIYPFAIIAILILLQSCSNTSTPVSNSATTSSAPVSSKAISSAPVSSKATSSAPVSSKTTSSTPVSSKAISSAPVSSKAISSAPVASKATSSTPVSSKATSSAPVSSNVVAPSASVSSIEKEIFKLVNEERASLNISPLSWNDKLYKSSTIRSNDMIDSNLFSHTRPQGQDWKTTLDEVSYVWGATGENIGHINSNGTSVDYAVELFKAWKNSPPHYSAMIDARYLETGISVITVGDITYATEHFGTKLD